MLSVVSRGLLTDAFKSEMTACLCHACDAFGSFLGLMGESGFYDRDSDGALLRGSSSGSLCEDTGTETLGWF